MAMTKTNVTAAKTAAVKDSAKAAEKEAAKTMRETVKETVKAEEKAPVKEMVKAVKGTVKTVEKAAAKETKKKPAVKKTAVKTVGKARLETSISVQFYGKSYTQEDFINIAKDVWKYDLKKKAADMKTLKLYVKPEESVVYYVINEEFTGSFAI